MTTNNDPDKFSDCVFLYLILYGIVICIFIAKLGKALMNAIF